MPKGCVVLIFLQSICFLPVQSRVSFVEVVDIAQTLDGQTGLLVNDHQERI